MKRIILFVLISLYCMQLKSIYIALLGYAQYGNAYNGMSLTFREFSDNLYIEDIRKQLARELNEPLDEIVLGIGKPADDAFSTPNTSFFNFNKPHYADGLLIKEFLKSNYGIILYSTRKKYLMYKLSVITRWIDETNASYRLTQNYFWLKDLEVLDAVKKEISEALSL